MAACARRETVISQSIFWNNRANAGGALVCASLSRVSVRESIFAFNTAEEAGGAVRLSECTEFGACRAMPCRCAPFLFAACTPAP